MPHLPGEPPLPLDLLQLGQPRWKCELAFRQAGFNANEAANFIFANMHRGEAWWASAGQAQGTAQGAFGGTAWAVNLVPPATPVVTTPAVVAADPVAMAGAPLRTPPAEPPTSAGAHEEHVSISHAHSHVVRRHPRAVFRRMFSLHWQWYRMRTLLRQYMAGVRSYAGGYASAHHG